MLFADVTDALTKGAEFGPLGWVLSAVFLFGGAITWFVLIPVLRQWREQQAKQFEQTLKLEAERHAAEEQRKEKLTDATATLSTATAKLSDSMATNNATTVATHDKVHETAGIVVSVHDKVEKLVSLSRENVEGLKVIGSRLKDERLDQHIDKARDLLHAVDNATEEHPSLSGTDLAVVKAEAVVAVPQTSEEVTVTRALLCLFLLCPPLLATDPAPAKPIRLPETAVPSPMPQPNPVPSGAVTKLDAGQLYVVDCSVECFPRVHPAGLVKVTKKTGPRDISAVFAGGKGALEDRTFAGPFVYQIEPLKAGRVEIDMVPAGLKSEADIVSTALDVLGGAPDAKPKPVPPAPKPTPKPVAPVLTAFQQKLADALAADGATKATLAKYAALVRQASTTTVNDRALTTAAALLAELHTAGNTLVGEAGLPKVRRAVADQLNLTLAKLGPLDDASRATIKAALAAVATALEAVANGK